LQNFKVLQKTAVTRSVANRGDDQIRCASARARHIASQPDEEMLLTHRAGELAAGRKKVPKRVCEGVKILNIHRNFSLRRARIPRTHPVASYIEKPVR
jgi:hypothetical protein